MSPYILLFILLLGFAAVKALADKGDQTSYDLAYKIGQGDRSPKTMGSGCGLLIFFSILLAVILLAATYATESGGFLGPVPPS